MRRSLLTTALVLAAGALYFVGCTDSTRVPTEPPSFKKGGVPAPQARINALIRDAFNSKAERNDAQRQMARIKNALAWGDVEGGQELTRMLMDFVRKNRDDINAAADLTAELMAFAQISGTAGVVGPDGGELTSPDKQAALFVPGGALSGDVLISFFKKEQLCFPAEEIPEEDQFDDCYTFEPKGLVFNQSFTVRVEVCLALSEFDSRVDDVRLHGFDDPSPPVVLVEEDHELINCAGFLPPPSASIGSSGLERFARTGLNRLMSLFRPEPLFAANAFAFKRLGGTRGSFTDIGWAIPQGPVVLQSTELCSEYPDDDPIATFDDPNLEAAIRAALPVGEEVDLTCSLIFGLTSLSASNLGITSLVGIQNLTSLTDLRLHGNLIDDISPLSELTSLTVLKLQFNSITNISALSGLTSLQILMLGTNSIIDISALIGLTNLLNLSLANNSINDISALNLLTSLTWLDLTSNSMTDISALSGLTNLTILSLFNNSITDISALSGLTNLTFLNLRSNPNLSNIQPLLDNTGLGAGAIVDLRSTNVSCTYVALLQANGVTVQSDLICPVTIDGVLQPGEWSDATTYGPVIVDLPGGGTTTATVFVMNDQTDLLLAVRFDDDLSSFETHTIAVRLDENPVDNAWNGGDDTLGDDGFVVQHKTFGSRVDLMIDEFFYTTLNQGQSDDDWSGTNNGVTAIQNVASTTVIEMSHPLNSGDSRDAVLVQSQAFGLWVSTTIRQTIGADLVTKRTHLIPAWAARTVQ